MTIKLLIVDDSALMRRQLSQVFEAEGDFEVRLARNGREAVDENRDFEPDVVTLDINMPEMDGLTALSHIMTTRSVPVVMVSSLTEKGALATFEALALGAVDYVAKPGGTISLSMDEVRDELIDKVRAAARARPRRRGTTLRASAVTTASRGSVAPSAREERTGAPEARKPAVRQGGASPDGLVVIGVSTGGPSTLEQILPRLPEDFPYPVVVAQHMPPSFTGPFAARINQACALEVVEANRPMELRPGTVFIARGGADLVIASRVGKRVAVPRPESAQHLWHPSVELLGRSVIEHCRPENVIAVMLTGMGNDGADAFAEIKRLGGKTIAESQESAIVFGMPKELIERGGATRILPAEAIAGQIMDWAR